MILVSEVVDKDCQWMLFFSVEQNVERGALNVEEGTKELSKVSACILLRIDRIKGKKCKFTL